MSEYMKIPLNISENGKIMLNLLKRHNLTAVNSMDVCEGIITRERATKNKLEKAVIDYVVVCNELKEFTKSMIIDEKRIHVLTKYASKKGKSTQEVIITFFSVDLIYSSRLNQEL